MRLRAFLSRVNPVSVYFLSLILGFSLMSCDVDVITNFDDGDVANTNHSASAEFSFRPKVAHQSSLRLDAISGSVEIVGVSDTDLVNIWGVRRVDSESTEDATAHLERLSVHVREDSDEIVVETEQPKDAHGRNYIVNYHIYVPHTWRILVEHVNGKITLSSMDNQVDIKLINGEVSMDSGHAHVDVELVNGSMRLWDISGNVEGTLVNGNIDSKVSLAASGTCKLKTVNGKITLSIPQSTSAAFSARVTHGTIVLSDLSLQDQHVSPTTVTGKLGAGDGRIDLEAVNGNIVVDGFPTR